MRQVAGQVVHLWDMSLAETRSSNVGWARTHCGLPQDAQRAGVMDTYANLSEPPKDGGSWCEDCTEGATDG